MRHLITVAILAAATACYIAGNESGLAYLSSLECCWKSYSGIALLIPERQTTIGTPGSTRPSMRIHPVSLAMRYLRGKRTFRSAPFYGRPTFADEAEAIKLLKDFNGKDFGNDTRRWSAWLRKNGYSQYADRI
jgi:hypothetical protein